MQTAHRAALDEVLRVNARLTAAMSSRDQDERHLEPAIRDELERARVILAFERGMAEYIKKGGRSVLQPDQVEAVIEHIRNREGHTA